MICEHCGNINCTRDHSRKRPPEVSMPPSELRALAERAKALSEQASKGPWKCDEWGYIENNEFCLGWLDGNNSENGADGALIVFAKNELSDYSDALLALLDENERLRYSHLPEAVEEPSDLENDFYDSATEGYSSNSRGMEHDDDGT